jgi:WD40 repeat protein
MKTRNPEIHITHGGDIQSLDYSKDGKRIITNSNDQNLKVWKSSTGRELLSVPASMAKSVKFSPDGMWLVANYPWTGKIFKAEDWNQNRGKFELKQKSIFRKWALANAQN